MSTFIKTPRYLILVIFLITSLACNIPMIANTGGETAQPGTTSTQTIPTQTSPAPLTPSATNSLTVTVIPSTSTFTSTVTAIPPTSTNTPVPIACNRAQYISDVNFPDGTQVTISTNFTKTWRIMNTGSCSWTSGYRIIFDSGDRMGAPDETVLTSGSIPPGTTADISVPLTAPGTAGNYKGYFRLKSPDNVVFGINTSGTDAFWVEINATNIHLLMPAVPFHFISLTPTPVIHFLIPRLAVTFHP
jgi:hypothetical protein